MQDFTVSDFMGDTFRVVESASITQVAYAGVNNSHNVLIDRVAAQGLRVWLGRILGTSYYPRTHEFTDKYSDKLTFDSTYSGAGVRVNNGTAVLLKREHILELIKWLEQAVENYDKRVKDAEDSPEAQSPNTPDWRVHASRITEPDRGVIFTFRPFNLEPSLNEVYTDIESRDETQDAPKPERLKAFEMEDGDGDSVYMTSHLDGDIVISVDTCGAVLLKPDDIKALRKWLKKHTRRFIN